MARWFTFLAESLTGGFFLWLGLYILSRGYPFSQTPDRSKIWWRQGTFAAGLSFILTSWFIFGIAMRSIVAIEAEYIFWMRITWWPVPLALIAWLRAILLMPERQEKVTLSPLIRWLLWVGTLAAAMLSYFSLTTDAVFHYDAIQATGADWTDLYFIPPNYPLYSVFVVFLLIGLFSSAFYLLARYATSPTHSLIRQEFRLLTYGTTIFIIGAAIGVAASVAGQNGWTEHVGYGIATMGIVLLGRGVVRYNALIAHRIIRQDFDRALKGTAGMLILFVAIFISVFLASGETIPPLLIPLLIYLVVLGTTPLRWLGGWVDRWTLPKWQAQFLWQLNEVRQEVLTAPNKQEALQLALEQLQESTQVAQLAQVQEMIGAEVATIFRHSGFKQEAVLAQSRLLDLKSVQQALHQYCQNERLVPSLLTEREKAVFLQRFLANCLDGLRPRTDRASSSLNEGAIPYLLLQKSYVEGKPRAEVIAEIEKETGLLMAGNGTGGRVYARYLQTGREWLADQLWKQELQILPPSS